MRIRFARQDRAPGALAALGSRWRNLESRATPSPFQSWTWVGCLAADRFTDPWLLQADDPNGTPVALALFNRRRGRFFMHETGDPGLDAPFIERNGILVANGQDGLHPALVRALPAALVLSGVDGQLAEEAGQGRAVVSRQCRPAPVLDLQRPVLDTVGANTRSQLRRAIRRYAEWGELSVTRAPGPADARAYLAELVALHQTRWQARNRPGAFADARTVAFHHALIDRGVIRHEVDLLRIAAGTRTIGLLYNLRLRERVFAYQGGFDYAAAAVEPSSAQLKPGLVCHALAAEWYRGHHVPTYDFGAGEARYKRSLATGIDDMHWLTLASPWSVQAGVAALKRRIRRFLPNQAAA